MKKASIIICVFLGCLVGHGWAARPSVSELLDELDEMIIQKKQYHARKEDKLKYLKEAFHMASDLQKKYEICGDLFLEYLHYQTDSALYYVNEKSLILSELDSLASKDEIIVSRAEVMGIMGMYNEALFELLRLSPSTMSKETLSYLKSATKLFSVLLASKRPLITELADKLRLKYPLLPTISPCPTMRLEAIRSIIPISCRRYPKSV